MASIVGSVSVGFGPPAAAKATAPKPYVESPPHCWCSQEKNETSYTPGSVVPTARMAIHLDLALPSGSSSLPEGFGRAVLERLLLGLAPDEACHAANCHQRPGGLLHRRFTLTHRPKPVRRSILCCAISQVALGGRYPPSCSMEPGSSSTDKIGRGHQEVSNAQL